MALIELSVHDRRLLEKAVTALEKIAKELAKVNEPGVCTISVRGIEEVEIDSDLITSGYVSTEKLIDDGDMKITSGTFDTKHKVWL